MFGPLNSKTLRTLALGLLIVISWTACESKFKNISRQRKSIPTIIRPVEDAPDTYADSLFSNLTFVPLSKIHNGLIGNIDKAIIRDNKIFLLDKDYAKSLFVFDVNGQYLFKFGLKGGGPGEFTIIEDFDVHDSRIYIYDSGNGRLSVFNLEGQLLNPDLKITSNDIIPDAIAIMDGKLLTYTQASCSDFGCYTLIVTDSLNNLLTADIPNQHLNKFLVSFGRNLSSNAESVFAAQIFNDTIYQVNKDLDFLTPYVIDFQRGSSELDLIRKSVRNRKNGLGSLMEARVTVGVVKLYASDNQVWMQYLSDNRLRNVIVDLETNAPLFFDNILFKTGEAIPFSSVVGSVNDQFIFYQGNEFLEQLKSKLAKNNLRIEELDSITDSTNGLIVIAKVKTKK